MKGQSVMAAVVIGASLILAAIAFALVSRILDSAGGTATEAALAHLEREAEGQAARIGTLESAIAELKRSQGALEDRLADAALAPAPSAAPPTAIPDLPAELPADQFGGDAAVPGQEGLADPMQLAKGRFNQGIQRPTPQLLRELLGDPRQSYSDQCQPVTNPRLIAALETRQVGNFKVTMLKPALDSFQAIMDRLQKEEPEIYASLGTAGALCVRHVRGAPNSVSSHAWGAAVDLTLTGQLDRMGDSATQFGLVVLAEFFNEAGWYWGAGYGREDSMHFEVGEALLRQWVADGRM
ncbi:MAG TPA: M15 family metallopeptidase [Amaricoccus sp.]|nr:M15 family metallopeptidase [Amaricoccus sp.]